MINLLFWGALIVGLLVGATFLAQGLICLFMVVVHFVIGVVQVIFLGILFIFRPSLAREAWANRERPQPLRRRF